MRVLLAILVIVCIGLALVIAVLATRKAAKKKAEYRATQRQLRHLEFTLSEVQNEVDLQLQAGYSDVNPFSQILNQHKEIES